jgi:hypothetical protein|tara:strand:- start:284 stop:520 length:237 start_codon:yes stop_codon:yes gene_type:complete
MKKEIEEGDLVYIRPTLFDDRKIGFVWKIEKRHYTHVIDPRVPSLTKEKHEDFYSVWVFEWSRSTEFLYSEIRLCDFD